MKKVYTVLFALLSSFFVFSQRVDLDKYNFGASYIDLPEMVIDTSYKTYFVEIDAASGILKDFEGGNPAELVTIQGWRKLAGKGHLKIFIRFEDIFIENVEVKERIEILKDNRGKETGRRSYYYMQLVYTFDADARLNDYKGNPIDKLDLADRAYKQTYNSREFPSAIEASFFYKYRGLDFTKDITKKAVSNALNNLSNMLTENYGFTQRTVSDFLWILDSKKHPEYNAHRKMWMAFKQAMFQMSAEEPLDNTKLALQPVIKYYESIGKKYSSGSKADKKLRYASHFNLAKIHYYLDDPDAAMREAGELMLNEFDEKDGRRLEAAATELKILLKKNKVTGRHFPIQTETYTGPETAGIMQ